MNTDAVLAVLPDSKEEAKSLREIAIAIGLDISLRTNRIRTEQKLAKILRALVKWGWVACDQRQRHKAGKHRRNTYWKTEQAKQG
jgi:hypothetical protein